jgi:hypothetical protein
LLGLGSGLGHGGVALDKSFGLEPFEVGLALGRGMRLDLRHLRGHASLGVRFDEGDFGLVNLDIDCTVLGPHGVNVEVDVELFLFLLLGLRRRHLWRLDGFDFEGGRVDAHLVDERVDFEREFSVVGRVRPLGR